MSAFDNEEQALADALRAQAAEVGLQPASFEAVRGRAGTIRRRRAVGAGIGLALAAAIIAPVGWTVAGPNGSREVPPATEAPSQVPTPSEDPEGVEEPGGTYAFTSDVPTGEAPRVSYIEGRTLRRPDGTTVPLLKGEYLDLATLGDRAFAIRSVNGNNDLYIFDRLGNAGEPFEGVDSVVSMADGTSVAWIDGSGEVWTYGETGRFRIGQAQPGSLAVALVGQSPCDGSEEGGGCGVFYNQPGEDVPMNMSEAGPIPVDGGWIKLADAASMKYLAGQTSYTDDSSCHQMVDESREVVFETCEHVLFQFSPNDTYLSANPTSYLDGFAAPGLTILDTAGKEVATWTNMNQPQDDVESLYTHVWEDDEHVLAVSTGPKGWHVLRLGVDGSIEKVLGPNNTGDPYSSSPYVLEGR